MRFTKSCTDDLASVINKHNIGVSTDTPTVVLVNYITRCLKTFDESIRERSFWRGSDIEEFTDDNTEETVG